VDLYIAIHSVPKSTSAPSSRREAQRAQLRGQRAGGVGGWSGL